MSLSLNNVRYGGKARKTLGTFRINENGMGWKNKMGKTVTILENQLDKMEQIATAKGRHQLRVYATDGLIYIFDGIPQQDLENIRTSAKSFFQKDIPKINLATKGWNWGKINFEGSVMNFSVDNQKAFDISLPGVEQASHDKNDVVVAFHQDSGTTDEGAETLVEMRFWIPNTEEGTETAAERVLNRVLSKADILSSKGTGMVTFPLVSVKTPRGRYDIEIFPSFMRMKGTQSSTISYDSITRLSYLKSADEKDYILIISLDPPLRRGHTSHPHILMQFPAHAELEADLTLTDEQLAKYKGKLDRKMTGNKFEVILQIFKVVTGIKTTKTGNFITKNEGKAVRCSLKAHDGYLYPMAKCFIFIYNPITLVPFDSISHVEFARLGASTQSNRTFDLVIFCNNNQNFIFNSIAKDEFEQLKNFLVSRGVNIRGKVDMEDQSSTLDKQLAMLGDEESEDEDFESGGEDESDDNLDYDEGDAVPVESLTADLGNEPNELEAETVAPGTKRKRRPGNSPSGSPKSKKQKTAN